jgi:hypothetical protein
LHHGSDWSSFVMLCLLSPYDTDRARGTGTFLDSSFLASGGVPAKLARAAAPTAL